jgi:hypothetical protein
VWVDVFRLSITCSAEEQHAQQYQSCILHTESRSCVHRVRTIIDKKFPLKNLLTLPAPLSTVARPPSLQNTQLPHLLCSK